MCGPVQYMVTVTEGGVLIINDNTTLTNYHATGLNNNTVYTITVTTSNNAGSTRPTFIISTLTNNNGKSIRPVYAY